MIDPIASPVIFIGHSHLYSLRAACEQSLLDNARYRYLFVSSIEERLKEEWPAGMHAALQDEIALLVTEITDEANYHSLSDKLAEQDVHFILSLGGNEHNMLGLIRTGPLYDFLFPKDECALMEGATLVPFNAMKILMERRTDYYRDLLSFLNEMNRGRLIVLESPPPIRDGDYIMDHLDKYYIDTFGDKVQINPASYRLKLWKLRAMVMRAHTAELGVPYIATPVEMTDGDGFLLPSALAGDATHANGLFGQALLRTQFNDF